MSTNRDSYAHFTIASSVSLTEIEAHMGLAGDGNCWSVGDRRKTRPNAPYTFSRWNLLSGTERGAPLDEHLRALWRRLADYREEIITLPEEMHRSVSCVGAFNSHLDNIEIASGHFATAAYYGLTLDCDFYFDDDFGDDEEGKPYWSW